MKRVAAGAVLIPLVLGIVYLPSPRVFVWIMMGVGYLLFSEFIGMFGERHRTIFLPAAVLLLLLINMLSLSFPQGFVLLTAVPIIVFTLMLPGSGTPPEKLFRAKLYLTGFLYIGLPLALFSHVREWEAAPNHWLLFALVIPWVCDTAAFTFGTMLGRHKMAPEISPKKTWEGFAAGVVFSIIAGAVMSVLVFEGKYLVFCLMVSAVVSVTGQAGDLAESLFKRSAGVKDSGMLIPGHGGMFDRMDSLLFSVATVYIALRLAEFHV